MNLERINSINKIHKLIPKIDSDEAKMWSLVEKELRWIEFEHFNNPFFNIVSYYNKYPEVFRLMYQYLLVEKKFRNIVSFKSKR